MTEQARKDESFDALYSRYRELGEGVRAEIVAGEIRTLPRPRPRHVRAASVLGIRLGHSFGWDSDEGPGGWVIFDEPELRLGDEIRALDLAGWRLERYEEPVDNPISLVPDWICEVLSPTTARSDRAENAALRRERRRPSVDRGSGDEDARGLPAREATLDRRRELRRVRCDLARSPSTPSPSTSARSGGSPASRHQSKGGLLVTPRCRRGTSGA